MNITCSKFISMVIEQYNAQRKMGIETTLYDIATDLILISDIKVLNYSTTRPCNTLIELKDGVIKCLMTNEFMVSPY